MSKIWVVAIENPEGMVTKVSRAYTTEYDAKAEAARLNKTYATNKYSTLAIPITDH